MILQLFFILKLLGAVFTRDNIKPRMDVHMLRDHLHPHGLMTNLTTSPLLISPDPESIRHLVKGEQDTGSVVPIPILADIAGATGSDELDSNLGA